MKVLLLVGVFLSLQLALCQDGPSLTECFDQKKAAVACIKAKIEGDEGFAEKRQKMEEFKEKRLKCFTDNGCEDPMARMKECKRCKKSVFESVVKPRLETCTGQTIPDPGDDEHPRHPPFGMFGRHGPPPFGGGPPPLGGGPPPLGGGPPPLGEGPPPLGGGPPPLGGGPPPLGIEKLKKLCETDDEAKAANDCLEALKKEKKKGMPKGGKPRGDMRAKMEGIKACFKDSVTEDCRATLKTFKKSVCDCAKGLKDDDALEAEIEAGIKQCKKGDNDDDGAEMPPHLERIIRKMCRGPPPKPEDDDDKPADD